MKGKDNKELLNLLTLTEVELSKIVSDINSPMYRRSLAKQILTDFDSDNPKLLLNSLDVANKTEQPTIEQIKKELEDITKISSKEDMIHRIEVWERHNKESLRELKLIVGENKNSLPSNENDIVDFTKK